MTEAEYQRHLQRQFEIEGGYAVKIHGNEFTKTGTPDIIGAYRGRTVVIEAKVGDNRPTDKQYYELAKWRAAGAVAVVANGNVHGFAYLGAFLEAMNSVGRADQQALFDYVMQHGTAVGF